MNQIFKKSNLYLIGWVAVGLVLLSLLFIAVKPATPAVCPTDEELKGLGTSAVVIEGTQFVDGKEYCKARFTDKSGAYSIIFFVAGGNEFIYAFYDASDILITSGKSEHEGGFFSLNR